MTENASGLYVLSLRDLRIQSLTGHCVQIKAQKPTRIPEALRYEAYGYGCVECDKNGKIAGMGDSEQPDASGEAGPTLEEVLYQIYVSAEVENLDTQGLPKVAYVNAMLGDDQPKATKKQIITGWMRVSEEQKVLESEGVTLEDL